MRLGQNFLVDSNILGVIERSAELTDDDVVLEIGGGLGVLSEHLARRVSHLHVIEIDERLRGPLEDAVAPFGNVSVTWGDAMKVDLTALSPAPGKVVANLPYGIAAAVLLRTIEQLERVRLWVAMVQREVGERLAARPGGGEYGVSSAIAQLSCEVRVLRTIPRSVFRPVPKVDSVLVEMRRKGPAAEEGLRHLVRAAFAHRRKALRRSVSMAWEGTTRGAARREGPEGAEEAPMSRERIEAALREMGLAEDVRAERLSAEEFRVLWELLCR